MGPQNASVIGLLGRGSEWETCNGIHVGGRSGAISIQPLPSAP
jgi:hypothetical protein